MDKYAEAAESFLIHQCLNDHRKRCHIPEDRVLKDPVADTYSMIISLIKPKMRRPWTRDDADVCIICSQMVLFEIDDWYWLGYGFDYDKNCPGMSKSMSVLKICVRKLTDQKVDCFKLAKNIASYYTGNRWKWSEETETFVSGVDWIDI